MGYLLPMMTIALAVLISGTVAAPALINDNLADIDVDRTLQNVQDILDANPLLPRLSKDEILALLNNITAEDSKLLRGSSPDKAKPENDGDEKIMVVMPYHAHDGLVNEELFTRAPIIKYVSSKQANREELTTTTPRTSAKRKPTKAKKASSSSHKQQTSIGDEAKDLTKADDANNYLASSLGNGNKFSVIEDAAFFNHELAAGAEDQSPLETSNANKNVALPDVAAYDTFKPIPEGSRTDESVPVDIRNILKALETEEAKPVDAKPAPTYEVLDVDSMKVEEMSKLLEELGMSVGKDPLPAASALTQAALSEGPDPLSTFGDDHDSSDNNIGKRQKDKGDDKKTDNDTDGSSSATTERAEESGPNMADLESSFGGSSADDDPSEAELPPPRKNGFYYMLDWNSFLEVGDGDTKVNIRFDPKLGDPQRFIAVTVP